MSKKYKAGKKSFGSGSAICLNRNFRIKKKIVYTVDL